MHHPTKDDPNKESEGREVESPSESGSVPEGGDSVNLDPMADMHGDDPEERGRGFVPNPPSGWGGDGRPSDSESSSFAAGLPERSEFIGEDSDANAWGWTAQYAKKPARRRGDADDDRGFGEIDDPNLSPEEVRMAAMYVPSEKVEKAHNPNLTFTPVQETKPFPWMGFFLILALLVAGMIALMGVVEVGTTDEAGNPIQRTPLRILFFKFAGLTEKAEDPNIAAWAATKDRLQEVYLATAEYERLHRAYPESLQKLVESNLIPESSSRDGWGNPFLLNAFSKRVLSPGPDRVPDTSDDAFYDERGLEYPSEFKAFEPDEQGL